MTFTTNEFISRGFCVLRSVFVQYTSTLICALAWVCLPASSRADDFYTAVSENTDVGVIHSPVWTNDPVAAQSAGSSLFGNGVVAAAGNSYFALANSFAIGGGANTRLRCYGPGGFAGDSLTLNTNTELRLKISQIHTSTNQALIAFTNSSNSGAPSLILNGGMINAGDASSDYMITGVIEAVTGTFSWLNFGNSDFQAADPTRTMNLAGQLTGGGDLSITDGGGTAPNVIVSGESNTFSGRWIVVSGYLQGAAAGSLGTNSITVDPLYPLPLYSGLAATGPALLEVNYDVTNQGTLTLTNGGKMILHQNCTFGAVNIEGVALTVGVYYYAQLTASFPANFPAGGSGSIIVQPTIAVGTPMISSQPVPQNVIAGQTAQFTAAAYLYGNPPGPLLRYQWQFQTNGAYVNLTDSGGISGSSGLIFGGSTTLTISNAALANAGNYQVVFSFGTYTVTSNPAALAVAPPPVLQITQSAGTVMLAWNTNNAAGWLLYSAAALSTPMVWNATTNVPVVVSGQFTVTVPAGNGPQFFRLGN